MISLLVEQLDKLKHSSGLFRASPKLSSTGYNRIWIRDNLYISLGYEAMGEIYTVKQIYWSLLDILLKHEYKIDYAIKKKPKEDFQYIHPIYTEELEEIKGTWGWKQNDSIGGLLFHIGRLENEYQIIRNKNDKRILQKLVYYLRSIEYWKDDDNGMWEENKEIHASSVGACVAGLKSISPIVKVDYSLIKKGEERLNKLLPNESITKNTDLSLLSLIYPYNVVSKEMSNTILNNIEKQLLRKKGIIRYVGDGYYNRNNIEASWTMGLPWESIIYQLIKNPGKRKYYIDKSLDACAVNNTLPELYIEDKYPNENNPLGWSQSLMIVALLLH